MIGAEVLTADVRDCKIRLVFADNATHLFFCLATFAEELRDRLSMKHNELEELFLFRVVSYLEDISSLENCPKLSKLNIAARESLVTIPPLAHLERLELRDCLSITDISAISSFKGLRYIDVPGHVSGSIVPSFHPWRNQD